MGKCKRREKVCAIFVHAGAGYHSVENEKKHLEACSEYVLLLRDRPNGALIKDWNQGR